MNNDILRVPRYLFDRLVAAAEVCAEDLGVSVDHEYAAQLHYPTMRRRRERDMASVIELREAIKVAKGGLP